MNNYALNQLDIKMLKYLNYSGGFFVEAGANNGVAQSNTLFLEKNNNWTGLLIEPSPKRFAECQTNRSTAICENYALVSNTYSLPTISGDFDHNDVGSSLMSLVLDHGDFVDDELIFYKNQRQQDCAIISVPVSTLDNLFQKHNISNIDFFSLDVEGYEISALNGMNFALYRPKYLLIETTSFENRRKVVTEYMHNKNYSMIEEMSCNDLLFKDNNI